MALRGDTPDKRFDVFLSYSHDDEAITRRLARRIANYRPPRGRGKAGRRLRIFRDVDRLTTHPRLSEALAEQIRASDHLVLLASPSAANSPYVNDEAARFLHDTDTSKLIIALVAGDSPASLPPSVRELSDEPLYADLRQGRGWLADWRRFRAESLRIIASVLEVDFDALYQSDARRRRRATLSGALLFTLLLMLGGGAWLISGVPPEYWAAVPIPTENSDSDLLVIRDIAVNRDQPGEIYFHAQDNRNYAHGLALENLRRTQGDDEAEAFNDSFYEAWDAAWAEWHLLSPAATGNGFEEEADGEEQWERIHSSADWLFYQAPERYMQRELPIPYRSQDGLPTGLRTLLDQRLQPLGDHYEISRRVVLISRQEQGGTSLQAATVQEENSRQMGITQTTTRHFLQRPDGASWHEIKLAESAAGATIEDIISFPGQRILLVTDRAGLFLGHADDTGFRDFNLGIPDITLRALPQPIATENPPMIYLLTPAHTRGSESSTGALWRYQTLTLWERLKRSLAVTDTNE